jgi:hypothetical protein
LDQAVGCVDFDGKKFAWNQSDPASPQTPRYRILRLLRNVKKAHVGFKHRAKEWNVFLATLLQHGGHVLVQVLERSISLIVVTYEPRRTRTLIVYHQSSPRISRIAFNGRRRWICLQNTEPNYADSAESTSDCAPAACFGSGQLPVRIHCMCLHAEVKVGTIA